MKRLTLVFKKISENPADIFTLMKSFFYFSHIGSAYRFYYIQLLKKIKRYFHFYEIKLFFYQNEEIIALLF